MSIMNCPGCGRAIQIPEPTPAMVSCPLCHAAFAPAASPGASPPPPPPAGAAPWGSPPPPPTYPPPTMGPVPGYGGYPYPPAKVPGQAVASMVLGIVSIPTCLFYGIPSLVCGILAVVFARNIRRDLESGRPCHPSAAGYARAGSICGTIGIVLSIVFWIFLIGCIMVAVNSAGRMHHSNFYDFN